MKLRVLMAATIGMTVAACATAEQRALREAQIEQAAHDVCVILGAVEGTPAYVDCRLRQQEMRAADRRAARIAAAASDVTCHRFGNSVQCF